MVTDRVPVVDMRDYLSGDVARKTSFVQAVGESLEALGFVSIIGHGVPIEVLESCYSAAQQAFALPDATKRSYEMVDGGRQRGYTPFGLEHAKDQPIPDLKEFWQIGRLLPDDHSYTVRGDVPKNRFPTEVPEFETSFLRFFDEMENFSLILLDVVAAYLGVDPAEFRTMVHESNSVSRVIHYPEIPDVPPGAVRAARHEDINLLTVLPASTRPGLELLNRDGEWVAIHAPPGVLICDTGDMMALITDGRLPATTHRVVNPEGQDGGRYSMPFFVHPHPDYMLHSLAGAEWEPVRTLDFLNQRLREIGLM